MKQNIISRNIFVVLQLMAVMALQAQPMRIGDNEHTQFSMFFNDGQKTQFGLYNGIQFFQEGERYKWGLINDETGSRYDIADFVAPVKLLTTPAPALTSQKEIDNILSVIQPEANFSWIAELMSDNISDVCAPHLPILLNDNQVFFTEQTGSYRPMDDYLFRFEKVVQQVDDEDSPGSVWTSYYDAIAQANRVLQSVAFFEKQADNISIETLKAAKAEALLQRAYLHFILVNLFAQSYQSADANENNVGIPYMEEVVDNVDKDIPALSVGQVYAKIQRDLEKGLGAIESLSGITSKYRFTPQAAHAFAARFYLYTRQWQKVVEHANAVLGTTVEQLRSVMLNYAEFSGLQNPQDFAAVWQGEENASNLMLNDTKSILYRRLIQGRYAYAGLPARRAFNCILLPMERYYLNPFGLMSGQARPLNNFTRFYTLELYETFEYTDKEAGIGYPHVIMRRFTGQELLLERAEAYIMSGNLELAKQDLMNWWNLQFDSFSETDKNNYQSGLTYMEETVFDNFFTNGTANYTPISWDFTTNISPDYIIPAEAWPVMNCMELFRQFETVGSGLRFFDLKRWGMEYSHFVGPENTEIKLTWNDKRRAIQVPWDAIYGNIPNLQLSTNSITLEPGEQGVVRVAAGSRDYSFTSNNPEVAEAIDNYTAVGIQAQKPGVTTITVTDKKSGQSQEIAVTVKYNDLAVTSTDVNMSIEHIETIISGNYDYSVESDKEAIVTGRINIIEGESQDGKPSGASNTYQLILQGHQEGQAIVTVTDNKTGQQKRINVNVRKSEDITIGDVKFTMIYVDGGKLKCDQNVLMDHDYAIGRTEVTQALWQAVMNDNPSSPVGNQLPANKMSWDDCQTFINKLNELTGRTFSLPTKAEWIFAARGGIISEGYTYAGSNELSTVAWNKDNSDGTIHEVATLAPNELGIYDMHGNVIEFCQDINSTGKCTIVGGAYVGATTGNASYFRWNSSGSRSTSDTNSAFGLRLLLKVN